MNKDILWFQDVCNDLMDTLGDMDGEAVADAYNHICSRKIKYIEDSGWTYSDEDDNITA